MTDLNAIKARLHSLAPAKLNALPKSVLRLIEEDLPMLLAKVERYESALLDIERNYDCDESSYQEHGAACRACKAGKALRGHK